MPAVNQCFLGPTDNFTQAYIASKGNPGLSILTYTAPAYTNGMLVSENISA